MRVNGIAREGGRKRVAEWMDGWAKVCLREWSVRAIDWVRFMAGWGVWHDWTEWFV